MCLFSNVCVVVCGGGALCLYLILPLVFGCMSVAVTATLADEMNDQLSLQMVLLFVGGCVFVEQCACVFVWWWCVGCPSRGNLAMR